LPPLLPRNLISIRIGRAIVGKNTGQAEKNVQHWAVALLVRLLRLSLLLHQMAYVRCHPSFASFDLLSRARLLEWETAAEIRIRVARGARRWTFISQRMSIGSCISDNSQATESQTSSCSLCRANSPRLGLSSIVATCSIDLRGGIHISSMTDNFFSKVRFVPGGSFANFSAAHND